MFLPSDNTFTTCRDMLPRAWFCVQREGPCPGLAILPVRHFYRKGLASPQQGIGDAQERADNRTTCWLSYCLCSPVRSGRRDAEWSHHLAGKACRTRHNSARELPPLAPPASPAASACKADKQSPPDCLCAVMCCKARNASVISSSYLLVVQELTLCFVKE